MPQAFSIGEERSSCSRFSSSLRICISRLQARVSGHHFRRLISHRRRSSSLFFRSVDFCSSRIRSRFRSAPAWFRSGSSSAPFTSPPSVVSGAVSVDFSPASVVSLHLVSDRLQSCARSSGLRFLCFFFRFDSNFCSLLIQIWSSLLLVSVAFMQGFVAPVLSFLLLWTYSMEFVSLLMLNIHTCLSSSTASVADFVIEFYGAIGLLPLF